MIAPDPRVDSKIAQAQPFARPILTHLRTLMHRHCPEGEEAIKWGTSAWTYKGVIVGMAAGFKAHVTFGFWYGKAVTGGTGHEDAAMGSFGRITSLSDLPSDNDLARMIAASIQLIDDGVKPPQFEAKKPAKPEAAVPDPLAAALSTSAPAKKIWENFAPGQRREYCEWVADAKQEKTCDARIAQALEWIAEGKTRSWKYRNC